MQLSEHFTLSEATTSQTALRRGLNNTPTPAILATMLVTASHMELIRTLLGGAIHVSSWLRMPSLNRAIGGSATSQHCYGEAVDFTCPTFGTPREIALAIIKSGIEFDQLIFEGTWVHISFTSRRKMRRQVLTATFSARGTSYSVGIK